MSWVRGRSDILYGVILSQEIFYIYSIKTCVLYLQYNNLNFQDNEDIFYILNVINHVFKIFIIHFIRCNNGFSMSCISSTCTKFQVP